MNPVRPTSFGLAVLPDHDLESDAAHQGLSFADIDLSGRSAQSVEFTQCRFKDVDLSGTTLGRGVFTDCFFENSNLANLRGEKSSLVRAELSVLRMTGFHWTDGLLRDARFTESRLDLSSFRFTDFVRVQFERCNLTGADFIKADLSGAQFIGCDLTGAQFSQANMEGARFAHCVLVDIGGVTSWQGAFVRSHDLVTLSYTLAAALGIRIEGEEH
ncbi:MAG: pentapeptide repeat-containing protein [Pseudonocardiales bacterium]